MALLDSPTFKPVSRDRLFFDQYKYCMCFRFEASGRMRTLTHKAIQNALWRAAAYRGQPRYLDPGVFEQRMLDFCDLINDIDVPFKRIVYTDWQYFYTNDSAFFQRLARYPGVSHCYYSQALVNRPRDTVVLKESKYQWRTYFRERNWRNDQIKMLGKFLLSRPDQFSVTSTWSRRLTNGTYLNRGFFVDHHSEQDALLINIALPGAVRKTMPIVEKQ